MRYTEKSNRNTEKSNRKRIRPDPELRKNSPELTWVMEVSKKLSLQHIQTLKSYYSEKSKEYKKKSHVCLSQLSNHYIYHQKEKKHDHSNFAKWIHNKPGRKGRGGINILVLLIWCVFNDDYTHIPIDLIGVSKINPSKTVVPQTAIPTPNKDIETCSTINESLDSNTKDTLSSHHNEKKE